MPFYADLHLHSKFARATSADADLEPMALWAAKKGVTVLGTGDFTHPEWLAAIKEKLVPAEPGLFRLRPDLERQVAQQLPAACPGGARFILQVEIATIYKKGERTRKVHHCIYAPDLAAAERLIQSLSRIGNLKADGRPILGLDSRDLLEITLAAGEGAFLIPAHIWTPWFAALGSKSGFDSIAECYGDLAPHIFALETGLSSDPPMNWRLSQLDRFQLVSNSDAHSPGKIGREACVFDTALDYFAMRRALETGNGYGGTVEFFPEEGKYHLDGHRNCGVCLEPEQTRARGGLCPTCGKPLTVGVMHRVAELADRPDGARHPNSKPFRSLIPLGEVLAEIQRVGPASRKVEDAWQKLVQKLGAELFILAQAPIEDIRKAGSTLLAEAIARMREARVIRQAGYDGEYGVIRLFTDAELLQGNAVSLLFELPAPGRQTSDSDEWLASQPADVETAEAPPNLERSAPLELRETSGGAPDLPLSVDLLAGLDPEQRAAAEMTEGALMIVAGPGTGKTRTLTHRIAHLIANLGVPAEQCLAVTFTNRAANEMKERLHRLLPAAGAITVTTFHGLGYRLLREHGARLGLPASFRIANEAEQKALLAEALECSGRKAEQWLKKISQVKCEGGKPADDCAGAFQVYQQALRERAWVDFDDLIGLAVELLADHPDVCDQCRGRFRWISVDEFQDIDARQYRLIKLLVPPGGNLCVIGDPDQGIYGFRGADVRCFQQLQTDFPAFRTVQLRRNYRSSRAIVEGALQAIAPGTLVQDRSLEALSAGRAKITIHESATDKAEAEFIVHSIEQLIGGSGFFSLDSGRVEGNEGGGGYSFSDFAVLYRTDAQAGVMAEALARSGIPFQRHSHTPLSEHPAVQALLAAARALPENQSALDRLKAAAAHVAQASPPAVSQVSTPASGEKTNPLPEPQRPAGGDAGDTAGGDACATVLPALMSAVLEPLARRCGNHLDRFQSELALSLDLDLWDARADRVSLLTLHASKGLEFAVVFIAGCEDGLLPLRWGDGDDDANLDEERRLFFVGMTRARERLFLAHAKRRLWRGQLRQQTVSPFVTAIRQELLERSKAPVFKAPEKPAGHQLDLFGP